MNDEILKRIERIKRDTVDGPITMLSTSADRHIVFGIVDIASIQMVEYIVYEDGNTSNRKNLVEVSEFLRRRKENEPGLDFDFVNIFTDEAEMELNITVSGKPYNC